MTKEEAKELLKLHSSTHDDIDHPKSRRGFLGMLRPFSGELIEENYHEVIACIKTLANDLANTDKVDKEVISALWGICHLTRSWTASPDGMLRQNNLLKAGQVKMLENWTDIISYATMMLLDEQNIETAFEPYDEE